VAYVLWRDEKRLGHISYRYFLLRRVLRIWPAYFVVIAAAYVHAIQVADPRADRLSGLLATEQNVSDVGCDPGHSYSNYCRKGLGRLAISAIPGFRRGVLCGRSTGGRDRCSDCAG
jgi:hypothetical protein